MLSHLPQPARPHATRALAPVLLWASLILPSPAAAVPAVSFESAGSGCGPSNLEGWQFKTTQDLTISAIGAYDFDLDGLEHDIPVGIFDDADCSLVTSALVPKGTTAPLIDQYRYVAIPPLVLAANKTYRAAAIIGCDDFTAEFTTLDGVVLHPGITAVVGKRIGFETMLTCPTEASPLIELTVNFMISPPCGNGIVQAGEQCDDGNAVDDDCCSNTCTPQHAGDACTPDHEICTLDRCDDSGVCSHPPGNAGSVCRPPDYDCDAPEICDGTHAECPEDDILPDQAPCTNDGLFCTGAETCFEGSCTSAGDPCDGATCDEDAGQCVAFTPTATTVPTASATPTVTATPSITPTPTATRTATPAATATVTNTPIAPATHTATSISTATVTTTPIATATRTATSTATATVAATPIATASHTAPPTVPPSSPTATGTVGSSSTVTPVATETSPLPTATRSPISTAVPTDTVTAVPTSSTECRGDCDGDRTVAINELIAAVANALNGCG